MRVTQNMNMKNLITKTYNTKYNKRNVSLVKQKSQKILFSTHMY